ncbi:hypothetical protein ACFPN1_08335 [Lysobacter yangpyeongensis]|uniref:Transmembrane protein n=1 Tax=Lysobacter yangpyeongensis TaxID=346182 RepID=A0ABW0SLY1_9GAMM
MFAHAFRFDQFNARVRNTFSAPRKPRHRVLRVLLGLIGLTLLAVLVMFGVFVGAAMVVGGLLFKLWKQRGKPVARDPRVLDGEFRTVDPVSLPR